MTEKTMMDSSQKNMALIKGWVDAVNRNDVEAELACWQPDGEFYAVPTGMTYKGIEEIRKAGEKSASVVGGQPVKGRKQITHLSAGEDWACVEYDTHADIVGPIAIKDLTLLPEGAKKTVITKACVVFQLKEGKIYRAQEYFDASSMAQQLGLPPEILAKMYASLGSGSGLNKNGSTFRAPIETVKQFFEAWNKKDLNGLTALLDSKVSGRNPLSGEEKVVSKEIFRSVFQRSMKIFPDLKMRLDRVIADGDSVAVEELETAALTATNRSYSMHVACFFRVNAEGLIFEIHNYWDTKTYFEQLETDPETLEKILYDVSISS